jgi:hypothetical protein
MAGILACGFASAQRGGGGMGEEGMGAENAGGGGRGGRGGDMGAPANFGPPKLNRLDIMTNLLKLDKDQKKEVKTIMDEAQKEAGPLREQMSKSRLKIGESVKAGSGQEDAVKSYAALDSQMAAVELKAFAKVYKLLDPDQKQRTAQVFQMMGGVFRGKSWTEEQ